jgi:nitric oxide reductase NorQ protein
MPATEKHEKNKVAYGSQGKRQHDVKQFTETRVRTRIHGSQLNLIIKSQANPQIAEKLRTYEIDKYDMHPNYEFPDSMESMIPTGVPEYITPPGVNYIKEIVRALYYFKQCALIGPSGTGKTHIVYFIAEVTGLPIWEVNCGLQTSTYDLFGRYIGLGKENWIDGQIISWCRVGGILYLDEANMMKQDIAARLNPILDTRGHIVLSEKDNEVVKRHDYGYVIISMNPFSSEFVGTKPLNAAFRRRMSVWINFDYLSVGDRVNAKEVKLVQKRSGIPDETAKRVVQVGAELRRQYQSGDLPYGPSPGDLMNWSTLISDGCTPLEAAEVSIVGTTSDDFEIQEIVRRIIKAHFPSQRTGEMT